MFKKILKRTGIAVLAILLLLIIIILFNTFRAKPWPINTRNVALIPLPDSAIQHMSEAIKIPTISISDTSAIDTAAFTGFIHFIERAYPLIHLQLSRTLVNQFSLVFEWKGENDSLLPFILMGHYDVVPVEPASASQWIVEPFSGTITDSCIWGRGTTDDKFGVISILEAVEAMLRKGFVPQRSIFLCFGHDEEVSGQGARAIVKYLKEKNVHAELVLDEGGQLSESRVRDVDRPIAVIGVGEKGYASFELIVQVPGGHSSMPRKETAIDIVAKALNKLRTTSLPSRITPELKEFLQRIGPSSDNFMNRMAVSNMWLFKAAMIKKISAEPEGNAMTHTTIVPTIIESGIKDNVIPTVARAIINSRILPGESSESVMKFIAKAIGDDRVQIKKMGKFDTEPSASTSFQSPAFKRVESAITKNIPKVIPTPYLMIGATDSRYYRELSDGVVNFFPMTDAKGFHGVNERLPILDLQRGINFIMTIIEESSMEFK